MYYHFLNDLKSFKTREFSTWKVYVHWLVVEVFFIKVMEILVWSINDTERMKGWRLENNK